MRKLLGSTLALAMLFTSAPAFSAELFKNVTWSGQIDLQAVSARNVEDFVTRGNGTDDNNDRIGTAQTRLMAGMSADLLDDVHATVSVMKNDRTYGTPGGDPVNSTNSQPTLGNNGSGNNGVLDNIFVDQAFFKIDKLGGHVDATFGRQFFGNPGDMIIYFGPSDAPAYGLPTTALDAARFDWSNDQHSVTAVVGKITGSEIGQSGQADVDLRGVETMCKGENHTVGAFLWNRLRHGTGALGSQTGRNNNLYVLGVRGKLNMGNAWIKGTIAKNFGTNRNVSGDPDSHYTGYGAMVNGGAKLEVGGVGTVTPWGEAAYGTGRKDEDSARNEQFTPIAGDFRPGLLVGRFSPAAGVTSGELGNAIPSFSGSSLGSNSVGNRVIIGAGVKVTPEALNKLTVGVQATQFRTQTNFAPTPVGGQEALGGNRNIGTEVGAQATWMHSDNVSLTGTVASFQPGGVIRAARNAVATDHRVNPATMAAFDVRVKFGGKGS